MKKNSTLSALLLKTQQRIFSLSLVLVCVLFAVEAGASTPFISASVSVCKDRNYTFSINSIALSSGTELKAPFTGIKLYLYNGTSYVQVAAGDPFFSIYDTNGDAFAEMLSVNMGSDPSFTGIKKLRISGAYDNNTYTVVIDISLSVVDCSQIRMDYGDAPDASVGNGTGNYSTTAADNGPAHIISSNLFLGNTMPDADPGDLQNTAAAADDISNTGSAADEDAVTAFPPLYVSASSYQVTVTVTNTSGGSATLSGWIDFNKNGLFETSERAQVLVPAGATSATLVWTGISGLTDGFTYARFRIAALAADVENSTGVASTGEVEDYLLPLSPANAVLPVVLTGFSATENNCSASLQWKTAQEIQSGSFEIQRSNNGGMLFETIAAVDAAGNSSSEKQYRYNCNLMPGVNLFRLKMIDLDNTITYSPVISVKCSNQSHLKIFPNPATDIIKVEGLDTGKNTLTLLSMQGSVLKTGESYGNSISMKLSGLPPSTYILHISESNGKVTNYRIVKK